MNRCKRCKGQKYSERGTGDIVCMQCGDRKVNTDSYLFNATRNGVDYMFVVAIPLSDKELAGIRRAKG